MKTIVALDLGSKTGIAYNIDGNLYADTWELASTKELSYAKKLRADRKLDIRVHRLIVNLESLKAHLNSRGQSIDFLVFEDVRFASSQAQAHLWASFRGAVWTFAAIHNIDTDCLDTGKLKKFAAGNGFATKEWMLHAWREKYPLRSVNGKAFDSQELDDNAIDALHLFDWAETLLNK